MQGHNAFQIVRQVRAPFGLPARERHMFKIMRMRQVIDARKQCARERLSIGCHAPNRNTAEADTMIALCAADQPKAAAVAACCAGACKCATYYESMPA